MDSVGNETEQDAPEELGEELDAQSSVDETLENSEPVVASAAAQGGGDGSTDAAETPTGWQAELEAAGFKNFDDVDNAVKALVESNKQRDDQLRQYAEQVRFYQDQSRFREQGQQQQPVAQQQEPEQKQSLDPLDELLEGWEDPAWANQFIEVDEEGNRIIADHVDEATREKILSIDRKLRRHQEMVNNPRMLAEVIDKRVDRIIQERFEDSYEQKQTQAQERQTIDSFVTENAEWLYRRDPASGEYLKDPVSGEWLYSEQGNLFLQHMDTIAKDGISSVPKQIHYAKQMMAPVIATASSKGPSPTDQAQARKREMQGRSNNQGHTQRAFNGVTSSGSGAAGANTMSFGEETLAAMLNGTE